MTVFSTRILHLRSYTRSHPFPLRYFSSSATPPPDPDSAAANPPSLNEVKANLHPPDSQNPDSQNPPQSPRKNLSFFSLPLPQATSPSRIGGLDEIRRNLAEFRNRSAPQSPSTSNRPLSFQELYEKKYNKQPNGPEATADIPKRSLPGSAPSLSPILESLQRLEATIPGLTNRKAADRFSRSDASIGLGGTTNKQASDILGKDIAWRWESMYVDLGKKLKMSRPEKRKGKWFSLQELNDRLAKVREEEERKSQAMLGIGVKDLRLGLTTLSKSKEEKQRQQGTVHTFGILGQLGGTPNYMLFPPKEHLAEKYFHPDNMSSAEKLKLELAKVKEEFKMSESDCGSSRVQVAQLTTKIKHLSGVLHKKDKHSRKGLQAMVQRRKKLLKYLRRTDWDSYCLVISKLGLRDNADVKA